MDCEKPDHMNRTYNLQDAEKRITEFWKSRQYARVVQELLAFLKHHEEQNLTDSYHYIHYLRDLYQAYVQLNDMEAATGALRKLLGHFQKNVNPRLLKPFMLEYYFGTWIQLGYVLSKSEDNGEALQILQKAWMLNLVLLGPDSQGLATASWYIDSIKKHGHISLDKLEPRLRDASLWQDWQQQRRKTSDQELECTACLTGQLHVEALRDCGGGLFICHECVARFNEFVSLSQCFAGDQEFSAHLRLACKTDEFRCSSCGRAAQGKRIVVPTPRAKMCSECLETTNGADVQDFHPPASGTAQKKYTCRVCRGALSHIMESRFDCNTCRRQYFLEGSGYLTEKLSVEECWDEIGGLAERHPEASFEDLAQRLLDGDDCIRMTRLTLEEFILTIRKMVGVSKTADIGISAEYLRTLTELTSALEDLLKKG